MTRISTHVLDTALGKPAAGVAVRLERQDNSGEWRFVSSARTDEDGRTGELFTGAATLARGGYRLTFDVAAYHAAQRVDGLFPVIYVTFQVREGEAHFHIPLLLSPNGYTTYRGS
jgi:5-hydroxyisourate hydrolase